MQRKKVQIKNTKYNKKSKERDIQINKYNNNLDGR